MSKNKSESIRPMTGVCCLLILLLPAILTFFPLSPAEASYFDSDENPVAVFSPTPTPTPTVEEATIDTTYIEPLILELPQELNSTQILDMSLGSVDFDCDGIKNNDDNCVLVYNPDQKNRDRDAHGDLCDTKPRVKINENDFDDYEAQYSSKIDSHCDMDGDGIFNLNDNCPSVCNPNQRDSDKNKIGDACEAQGGIEKICGKAVPGAKLRK